MFREKPNRKRLASVSEQGRGYVSVHVAQSVLTERQDRSKETDRGSPVEPGEKVKFDSLGELGYPGWI
jgi:hypothetical protein